MRGLLDNTGDTVIESWASEDGTLWHRVYKSGFIEQGGYIGTGFIANFSKPFKKQCLGADVTSVSTGAQGYVMYLNEIPSLTTLTARRNSTIAIPFCFRAWGY